MGKLDLSTSPETAKLWRSISEQIESLNSRLVPYYQGENRNVYTTDFLVLAAAKRTLSLGRAFLAMMAVPNFGVAAALLRMQLDTALRFSAMAYVESPNTFASEMLRGDRIDKMKTKSGARLTDKLLVERLAKKFPWIPTVYEQTSGYIHLSGRHMWQTFGKIEEEGRTVQFTISDDDVPRPASDYVEILGAFNETTEIVFDLLISWLDAQRRPAQ